MFGSKKSANESAPEGWERALVERLATNALVERRRARRWGIFFRFVFLIYLTVIIYPYLDVEWPWVSGPDRYTGLIDVDGIISAGSPASADRVVTGLRAAFEDERTAGVIVRINSPGGSPVQAGYIYDEIRRLRAEYPATPVYAVIADICASGGYYIAAGADAIYANESSIVGSIGVLVNGFGFVETMRKLGVERRLLTAGEHKGLLDPFSPQDFEEVAHMQRMVDAIHEQFISVVKTGRGERLNGGAELFSGLVWTGTRSVALGLVDGLGSSGFVARELIEAPEIVDFTVRGSLVEQIARRLVATFGWGARSLLLSHNRTAA